MQSRDIAIEDGKFLVSVPPSFAWNWWTVPRHHWSFAWCTSWWWFEALRVFDHARLAQHLVQQGGGALDHQGPRGGRMSRVQRWLVCCIQYWFWGPRVQGYTVILFNPCTHAFVDSAYCPSKAEAISEPMQWCWRTMKLNVWVQR